VPVLDIEFANSVAFCLTLLNVVFELLHVTMLVQELAPDAMVQFGAEILADGPLDLVAEQFGPEVKSESLQFQLNVPSLPVESETVSPYVVEQRELEDGSDEYEPPSAIPH